jgi:hypothetical protein
VGYGVLVRVIQQTVGPLQGCKYEQFQRERGKKKNEKEEEKKRKKGEKNPCSTKLYYHDANCQVRTSKARLNPPHWFY